jgi:uncharacterized protein involved in exopolysaccharide biosynthesis
MARVTVIPALALSAALGGFLISYAFPPHYTARSTVVAEDHFVVPPVITADFAQSVQTLSQNVLAPSRLRPVIHALNLVKPEDEGKLVMDIQQHVQVEPVITATKMVVARSPTDKKEVYANQRVLGLNVEYTDINAVRAQKICNALAALIVEENLRSNSDLTQDTSDYLGRQLKLAKDDLEHKRAQVLAISKSPSPRRSPKEEAAYKALALDYDKAKSNYKDLLAKENTSELGVVAEIEPLLGEQVHIVTADLPQTSSFPNRLLFSLCGLGGGLLFGIGLKRQ